MGIKKTTVRVSDTNINVPPRKRTKEELESAGKTVPKRGKAEQAVKQNPVEKEDPRKPTNITIHLRPGSLDTAIFQTYVSALRDNIQRDQSLKGKLSLEDGLKKHLLPFINGDRQDKLSVDSMVRTLLRNYKTIPTVVLKSLHFILKNTPNYELTKNKQGDKVSLKSIAQGIIASYDKEQAAKKPKILESDWRKEEPDEDSIYAKVQNTILPIINSSKQDNKLSSFVQNLVTKENLSAHPYQVIRTLMEIAFFYPEAQIKAKLPKLDKDGTKSILSEANFEFNTYDLARYALYDLLSKDNYEYHPSRVSKLEPGEMHFKNNDLPSLREIKRSFARLKTRIKLKTIPGYADTPAGRMIKTKRKKLKAPETTVAGSTSDQVQENKNSEAQIPRNIEITPIEILSPAAKIIKDKNLSEEVLRIFDTAIKVIFSYDENSIKGTLENLLSNRILQYGELTNLKEKDTKSFKSLKKRERVAILTQKLLSLDNFKSNRPLTVPASIHQLCNLVDPRVKFEIEVPTLDKIFQNDKTIESNFASETKVLSMIELYKYVLDFINKDLRSENGRSEDPARNFKHVYRRAYANRKRKYDSCKTTVNQKLEKLLNPKTKS